jgi:hypothetical protein
MALLYQDMHEGTRLFVITHLVTQQGTITAQYPSAARIEYTRPALRQYIQQRNKWSDATMASINWNSHGQALQNHLYLRLHFSKLVHDILPTTAHLHKMDRGKRERLCCSHKKENQEHIIRCPHPARNKWRHELITTAIHNTCITRFTSTPLRVLLEDTMRAWMYFDDSKTPVFQVQASQYPQEMSF